MAMGNDRSEKDDYDSPWKEAIEEYFQEFMEFYFSEAAAQINWEREYKFRENELQQVVRDAELGRGRVDKLVEVELIDGKIQWVYVHIEVQSSYDQDFSKRMFTYNYRIFDRNGQPVGSFALLGDYSSEWRPSHFGYDVLGCRMQLDFPMVKLVDYENDMDQLIHIENVFGLVTAAHLLTKQTRGENKERYKAKFRLIRLLYDRDWTRQKILDLFAIIDWMMWLPSGLDRKLGNDIQNIEEEKNMQYVTSVERIARERGWEAGVKEGRHEESVRLLRLQLEHRFGAVPDWVDQRLCDSAPEQVETWATKLIDADTLEDVFSDEVAS